MFNTKSGLYTTLFICVLLALSVFLGLEKDPDASIKVFLAPEILFTIGSFPVTNSFFWEIVLSLILIVTAVRMKYSLKQQPGTFQNIVELLIEGGYKFVDTITKDDSKTKRVFPLVFTMFFFILFTNLFGFLPGEAAIHYGEASLFRSVMADYSIVLMLTVVSVITVQIVAIVTYGPFGYLKKFINFSSPLNFILGLMEIISELAKILSLSFRLFGNIFAGEVLAVVMLFLMPYFLPLPFMFLGLLSAIIQAFVFSLLTTIFITMASELPAPADPVVT
ncbi:F0F1 ATP synthase subunit A [Candidatus Nomurabacteria bacterium]|nr:F0F1 ATP synthase subunit A [Candidatus Kaiserbacteria bacterium]MCB9814135.1 F0F1 ATP synthase subunit A [Candidatus Nomurabacteria bacterium]